MGQNNKPKKNKTNDDDPYKIGTVLFSSGDAKHSDVWDDSDLIDHWDRNVEAYRRKYSSQVQSESASPPFQQNKRKTQEGHITKKQPVLRKKSEKVSSSKIQQTLPSSTKGSLLPSMPPMPSMSSNQEDLSNLMMAWYYSGYYTGLYQAQQRK
ncbi:uncharacterized protein EV154DRAFT_530702 [Mucor mucedo]|uniref:uncharacterized protein n=1 Tax=Mucor mucedo TaxID=29922 RepID=UPI00221F4507|nr:uncharacterized protein EV154DRAFT_530702 [Mucor mucedo]KAI7869604.1 hypothetical protein EV154DRAFT_530702 [Mucor mucedo]